MATRRGVWGLLWKLLLSVALAAALLALAFRAIAAELQAQGQDPLQAVGAAVAAVSPVDLLVYAGFFTVVHAARVLRWVEQVRPLGETDRGMIIRICAIGYGAIVLFPLRLGEVVRPFLLARESKHVDLGQATGVTVTERIIDGLLITALLFVAVATAPEPASALVRSTGYAAAVVFGSASGGLILFVWKRTWAVWLLRNTLGRVHAGVAGKIEGLLQGFVDGLRSLGAAGALWRFLGWTLVYWGANAVGMWWLARAFDLPIPIWGGFGLLAVLVVGIMLPAGIGFLGNFQLFLGEGLRLYLPVSQIAAGGLAFALVMNGIQLLLQVGIAIPFLLRQGMGLRGLVALQQEAEAASPAPVPATAP